jgi:type VI protein secretion system component Hcp
MKKLSLALLLFLLAAVTVHAETIAMTTAGQITCTGQKSPNEVTINLTAWNWESSLSISSTGAVGKTSLSSIVVNKPFDDCTSAMLQSFFNGAKVTTVLIEQSKPVGGSSALPVAEVKLTNAYLSSYSISGTQSTQATESWTLIFDKICVTTYGITISGSSSAGATVCYAGGVPTS